MFLGNIELYALRLSGARRFCCGRNRAQGRTAVDAHGYLPAGDPNLKNVPAGASLWTFQLFDK